ncbi:filamentous hemagglutinin family protein [Bradyrhizobium huanghuaihaiense]|uniref:Filamentous hemagglutinin family protein n=1 Tax=Bradyrhizobium huanghuaihaiense TaxID=990078 RepID=A0A562RCJ2_9BRAD|nr:filamentous hemagglutinin N-terminal domain-containing protein [Bradyrhizobium huanghuaihaiense]TWI66762.1 filamentous hemagglutinin family protein [Bradyrhizobium huanghuaihaiense]
MTSILPKKRFAIALSATTMLTPPALAQTLPTGGQVVSGQATISQSGNAMTINQSSERMIANWQSFSIGAGNSVTFNQPGASSVALNRVVGQDPSKILGSLSANGQVFLINPNGIAVGKTGSVQTGGFVASTLGISNADFLAGRYNFTGSSGAISNEGSISGKVVALISPSVSNSGTITGSTALAAGTDVLLDFNGDGLLSVEVKASTVKTLVENKGLIRADGGVAILTAKGASDAMKGVVNNTGMVQAASIGSRNGRILLLGDARHGEVNAGGTLRARSVETSAAKVSLAADLKVDTLGGHWLIDPVNITIDANYAAALQTALASGDVTVTTSGSGTDAGNIAVNAPISWASHILTLRADNAISINAPLTSTGTTGLDGLVLQYAQTTTTGTYSVNAPVNLSAGSLFRTQNGSAAPITYTVITDLNALQNINTNLIGNYVLGTNIDASATAGWNGGAGFTPIGGNGGSSSFSGIFDGLGHVISNLTINRPSTDNVGLFGYIDGATIRNVGLEGGSVTGNNAVGGLVGLSGLWVYGGTSSVAPNTISNVYNTGNVTAIGALVGGLVGDAWITAISDSHATGTIAGYGAAGGLGGRVVASFVSNSYATGNVSATWDGAGGLIAYNIGTWMGPNPADYAIGTVSHSYATGTVSGGIMVGGLLGYSNIGLVTDSYATGNVSGTGAVGGTGTSAGGLVGFQQYSRVDRSYATGNVSGVDAVGGLVGASWYGAVVSQSYATGNVSGTRSVGGLVGHSNEAVWVLDSYATGAVSGNSEVGGLVGMNQESNVVRSYFAGTVSGTSNVGAIVGLNWDGGQVIQSYANRETSGQSAACGGSGGVGNVCDGSMLTTAQLRDPFTFINNGYDFAAVWGKSVSGANNGMPVLRAFGDTVYDAYVNVAGSASTTYGTLASLGGLTATGVNADRVTLGWGSAVTTSLGAGSYNLSGPDILRATGSGGPVYIGSTAVGLTVGKAPLTITTNASKTYDGIPFFGGAVTYSGFMNGETASVLSGVLHYGGTAQGAVNVGNYSLTASGLSSANYDITYIDGRLQIMARDMGGCSLGAGGSPVCGATSPDPAAPIGLSDLAPIEIVPPPPPTIADAGKITFGPTCRAGDGKQCPAVSQ